MDKFWWSVVACCYAVLIAAGIYIAAEWFGEDPGRPALARTANWN